MTEPVAENPNMTPDYIHKAIALELLEEMQRGKDVSTILSKDKIVDLIGKIKEKDANYYLCHLDLDNTNEANVKHFDENKNVLYKALLKEIQSNVKVDIEFYKIGVSCSGLKQRHAIISNDIFFSSKDPLVKFDPKKAKNKTPCLNGCQVILETIQQKDKKSEWSNSAKPYRMRINFLVKEKDNKPSSFFLYFLTEKEMREVEELLFSMCKGPGKIELLGKDIREMERCIQGSYFSYAVLKILEVKAQVKRRKALLNTMRNASNSNMNQMMTYGKNLSLLFIKAHKAKKENINDEQYYHGEFNTIVKQPNLRSAKRAEYKYENTENMRANLEKLQLLFPDLFNSSRAKGKSNCFVLKSSAEMINNNAVRSLSDVRNKRYLSIDKENDRLTLSQDDNNGASATIDSDQIYEISNVLLNVNKTVSAHTPGYMLLCGPKIDESIPLVYKYQNIDKYFNDPEYLKLKKNTALIDQTTRDIIRIQIFHLKYQILQGQLEQINSLNAGKGVTVSKPKEDLLFFLTVTLREGLCKRTKMVSPALYSNNLAVVEFNQEIVVEKKEFDNSHSVYVEIHMIPKGCFDPNMPEEQRILLLDYFHPTYLGRSELTSASIKQDVREYAIRKNEIELSDENILFMTCLQERSSEALSPGFIGEDFCIGGYSFVPTEVKPQDILQRVNDPSIPYEIKQQYYDFQLNEENEFLFRPNENTPESTFAEQIGKSVSEPSLKKIFYNKRFHFLPMCEKYFNRETLDLSPNLACLSTEEKDKIASTHTVGDWIYKASSLVLALKNKNIGITEEREVLGENLYFNNIQEFNLQLDKDIELSKGKSFNTIDFTNIDIPQCRGFNNFQWVVGFPFKSEKTMNVFLQLLRQLRGNSNKKQMLIQQMNDKDLEINRTLVYWKKLLTEDVVSAKLQIHSLEFIAKYSLKEDATIDVVVTKSQGNSKMVNKKLLDFLKDQTVDYANSLLKLTGVRELFEWSSNLNTDKMVLENKTLIQQSRFNSGFKYIVFKRTMIQEVKCTRNLDRAFMVTILFKGRKQTETLRADVDLEAIVSEQKLAEKYLVPIYCNEPDSIVGILHLNCWKVQEMNKDGNFEDIYRSDIESIFPSQQPNHSNTEMQLYFGKYEPNVYSRRTAKALIEFTRKGSPTSDLVSYLQRKCIISPHSVVSNDTVYPANIILNLTYNNPKAANSLYREFRMKIYDNKLRKDFMHLYCKNEWKLFFKKYNKAELPKDEDAMFYSLPPRSSLKNSDVIKQLRELIYIDIPSKKGRDAVWEYFLDIDSVYQATKEKLKEENFNLTSKEDIYNHFAHIVQREEQVGIIFTLIDNDTNYITPLIPRFDLNQDVETIKTIAKAFFLWAKLDIKLNDKSKDSQYIYFVGLLRLIQRLYNYFNTPSETFWLIIGLAQVIEVFKQKNPIYDDEMSLTSLYVLITKLILQSNFKEIYQKFLSLNFPIEFFLSKNISTFYCDYFSTDTLMRVLDIFILEATIKQYSDDKLEYLRLLCTIPITLFELNAKKILECKSIAELEMIMEDLIVKTNNTPRFIEAIDKNVSECFSYKNFIEKLTNSNPKTMWDKKRNVIKTLLSTHFKPIQKENTKYLKQISANKAIIESSKSFIDNYCQGIITKLENIKQVHGQNPGALMSNHPTMGLYVQINKLYSIFYPSNLETRMAIYCVLSDQAYRVDAFNKRELISEDITYNLQEGRIMNADQLYFELPSKRIMEKYAHFILVNKLKRDIAWFTLETSEVKVMALSTVVIESFHHEKAQLVLEVSLMKYSLNTISSDDLALYNALFNTPEYIYNEAIDNEMNASSNQSKAFDREITRIITDENASKLKLCAPETAFAEAGTIEEIYKKNSLCSSKREMIIEKDSKDAFARIIIAKVEELLKAMVPKEIEEIMMNWLKETSNSFEEILYSLVLIDKDSYSITEKMYLLFSIAKMSNYLVYKDECVTVAKLKEMVYTLYKRYMIYFTKSEIDRMVDYLVHDERLFNVKYAVAYSEQLSDRIHPILNQSASFSLSNAMNVPYEDISVQLNAHIAYLINHHNVKALLPEMMIEIIKEILSNVQHKVFKDNQYNMIQLVISSDNIQYSKLYRFTLSPITIEEINQSKLKPKSHLKEEDLLKQQILCGQANSINLCNSYAGNHTVTFNQFKKIFFALPFLSDLLRVSCSYINEMKDNANAPFEYIKVCVGLEKKSQGNQSIIESNYYFTDSSSVPMEHGKENVLINEQVRLSWTIKDLLDKIAERYSSTASGNRDQLVNYFTKPHLFIFYAENEQIGLYECLSSNLTLKLERKAEIFFLLSSQEWTKVNELIIVKDSGFTKFYYTPTAFEWRKCWIISQQNTKKVYFKCCKDPTPLQASEADIITIGTIDA